MMIALDTECSGLDLYHGAKVYFITVAHENGTVESYEWPVDPLTRVPVVDDGDVAEVAELIRRADVIVGHNLAFDHRAMRATDPRLVEHWDWSKVRDTLLAAHLLSSNTPHNLTDCALQWLGVDIEPLEKAIEAATQDCRRICRSRLPNWAIASRDRDDMPSVKEKSWKADMWLPQAICVHAQVMMTRVMGNRGALRDHELWMAEYGWGWSLNDAGEPTSRLDVSQDGCRRQDVDVAPKGHDRRLKQHPYNDVLAAYANADSAVTLALWCEQEQEIEGRGLGKIYAERLKVLPVVVDMEDRGVTFNLTRTDEVERSYVRERDEATCACVDVAWQRGVALDVPRGAGNNGSLTSFVFGEPVATGRGPLGLSPCKWTDGGAPSLDKYALDHYAESVLPGSQAHRFVLALRQRRKLEKSLEFLTTYRRFSLPYCNGHGAVEGWGLLHPSINVTGTDTLRTSCMNPNAQQCQKGEVGETGTNPRHCFGPAPGREWWALDYSNLELTLPSYEGEEKVLIDLLEKPDKPPFYGSLHLLNASVVYPDLFNERVCPACLGKDCDEAPCQPKVPLADVREGFKKKYKATWYQWIKNAGFAVLYGAQQRKFDSTAHKAGAYQLVRQKLRNLFALNDKWVAFANRNGYVETMPDRTVDPNRGYPIMCSRSDRGGVTPTQPFNYRVQGTGSYCTIKGMVRCHEQLEAWKRQDGFSGKVIMLVHDEVVFDFPAGKVHPSQEKAHRGPYMLNGERCRSNLWRARRMQELMEESGRDIGVPLRVSVAYHPVSWGKGEEM